MVDAVKTVATAQRLLSKHGRTVTLIGLDEALGDASKPWAGATAPRTEPDNSLELSAVFVDPTSARRMGFGLMTEDLVKRTSKVAIVAPGISADLSLYQELLDGTQRLRILTTDVLQPGTEVLLGYVALSR